MANDTFRVQEKAYLKRKAKIQFDKIMNQFISFIVVTDYCFLLRINLKAKKHLSISIFKRLMKSDCVS